MPLSPLPNTGVIRPSPDGDTGIWDDELNAALVNYDGHDHTSGKGLQVPTAGIKINADLTFVFAGTYYAVTNVKAVDLQPQAVGDVTSYSSALFTNSADNNLYFRNSAGTNVQITNGATLNASIIGGIGGDYASVGALLDYLDASDAYRMRQQVGAAVQQFARLQVGDVDLYEYKAHPAAGVPANRVRLKSPAALAGSYDITFMGALPGSTALLQMSAAGVLTASSTLVEDLIVPSGVDIVIQAGGDLKHDTRIVTLSPHVGFANVGTWTIDAGTQAPKSTGAASEWWYPVNGLRVGDRIITVEFYGNNAVAGSTTSRIRKNSIATPGGGTNAASVTSSVSGDYVQTAAAVNYTIITSEVYWVQVIVPGAGDCKVFGCRITYDHP